MPDLLTIKLDVFGKIGGVFLPELLCEYRVHGSSRSYTTQNYDTVMAEMSLRHPRVVKPSSAAGISSEVLSCGAPALVRLAQTPGS